MITLTIDDMCIVNSVYLLVTFSFDKQLFCSFIIGVIDESFEQDVVLRIQLGNLSPETFIHFDTEPLTHDC